MANQYHDELGRFCSKAEMGGAVDRLFNLLSSAPSHAERKELAAQWISLRNEYEALVKPDYSRRIAELDAAIYTTSSKSVRRKLEAEREQLQLEADASDEGYSELLHKRLALPSDSPFRFADDQRIERAAAHRIQRETDEAVQVYESSKAEPYYKVGALFKGLDVKVMFTNKRAYVAEPNPHGYEVQHNLQVADADFDQQAVALRRQLGDRAADGVRFGRDKLDLDLRRSNLRSGNLDVVARAENASQIVNKDSGEILAEAEFNENGAFVKASVAHASGDGSIVTLTTPAQFRGFLSRAAEADASVKALPAWKTGVEEPRPAFAAPPEKDLEELDVLF